MVKLKKKIAKIIAIFFMYLLTEVICKIYNYCRIIGEAYGKEKRGKKYNYS